MCVCVRVRVRVCVCVHVRVLVHIGTGLHKLLTIDMSSSMSPKYCPLSTNISLTLCDTWRSTKHSLHNCSPPDPMSSPSLQPQYTISNTHRCRMHTQYTKCIQTIHTGTQMYTQYVRTYNTHWNTNVHTVCTYIQYTLEHKRTHCMYNIVQYTLEHKHTHTVCTYNTHWNTNVHTGLVRHTLTTSR